MKKLISARNVQGENVKLICKKRVEDEAEVVVKKIIELHDEKQNQYSYKDFAILVRANDHAQSFIKGLERAKIPYQFLGPGRLFHQEEIKDLIAYLKILYNFEDNQSLSLINSYLSVLISKSFSKFIFSVCNIFSNLPFL